MQVPLKRLHWKYKSAEVIHIQGWRQDAKRAIRDYPMLCARLDDLHSQTITPRYAPSAGGSEAQRTVENIAVRDLPPGDARRHRAVELAITTTRRYTDAQQRMQLVKLVFWSRSHTVSGAAVVLHISEGTAKAWHAAFVELVDAYLRVLP